MCFAIPGKVVSVDREELIVDYEIEKRKVVCLLDDVREGDYVIVSAGFVIKKVPEDEALETIEIIKNPDKKNEDDS